MTTPTDRVRAALELAATEAKTTLAEDNYRQALSIMKGCVVCPIEITEDQATALSEKLGLFVDLENAEPEWIDNAVNTLHGCVIAPYVEGE